MDSDEKSKLQQKVQSDIAETELNIERLAEITRPIAPDVSLGRLTRMDALASKAVNESALEDARVKLAALRTALIKLDGPDYGVCVVCGGPIAPARLEFLPESKTCIACAS